MGVKAAFIAEKVSVGGQSIYIIIDKMLQIIDNVSQGTFFGKLGFGILSSRWMKHIFVHDEMEGKNITRRKNLCFRNGLSKYR
jgi:predicted transglutaminase-like protease